MGGEEGGETGVWLGVKGTNKGLNRDKGKRFCGAVGSEEGGQGGVAGEVFISVGSVGLLEGVITGL